MVDERFDDARFDDARGAGTLAPFSRASLSPIAIACFGSVTFCPDPLRSVPFLRRCIADATVFDAFFPYFAMVRPPTIRGRAGARRGRVAVACCKRRSASSGRA